MIRNVFIFSGTFFVGAIAALVIRAAMFSPHADHGATPHAGGEYAAMVSNPLTPAPAPQTPAPSAMPAAPTPSGATVNSVCAICGMEVDPALPTAEYQGKTIGFGCRMCPPKFKADPDRYGPFYLRNEVIKR